MTEKNKPKFFKRKWFWINTGGVIVIFILAFFIGSSSMATIIDGEKLKYEGLVEKSKSIDEEISKKQQETIDLQDQLDQLNEEHGSTKEKINNLKKELGEALALIKEKEIITQEINELTTQEETKTKKIQELDGSIEAKEKELAVVSGKIIELKDKPKTLSAGFFTVGKDIPASRYKVTPNGNGNFFVNEGAKVNIMLGRGDFYESEYVFQAEEGDVIELTLSATFTPIQ
ncbi:hypothetical protein N780_15460 [Pontibacillus chungwhensis BH030062]|uniref:Uncharacterized protein n=1 Tax=Pontibacillus chungwhensis BH030062 TaxID=1385513 RepID=A0A0A2UYD7_9BACI|nr:hypothetical protein [Pontibacillus chungwhensis]KGP91778.1 hypothetical protein N780_15460 [Pontibacillus chungwhensis BH030062]